ncbi:MAG: hypothetical protein N3D20_01900 [Candidatus Pacearchaeota archaeon]|nr:hypothetical protein [Candidatus Pacearchaeota archaeon]
MVIKARENVFGAWAFSIGIILSILVGLLASNKISPYISWGLALLGIIVGFFVAEKDVQTFLLASVSVVIVSYVGISGMVLNAAIGGLNMGKAISSVMAALLNLFVPATIVVAIKTVFSISKV